MNGKAIPKFGNCWRNSSYKFVPFETPIPVGQSKKSRKLYKAMVLAIFTKNSNDILEKF
nr:hypothetical protein [Mycoplasmopsis bovis]